MQGNLIIGFLAALPVVPYAVHLDLRVGLLIVRVGLVDALFQFKRGIVSLRMLGNKCDLLRVRKAEPYGGKVLKIDFLVSRQLIRLRVILRRGPETEQADADPAEP